MNGGNLYSNSEIRKMKRQQQIRKRRTCLILLIAIAVLLSGVLIYFIKDIDTQSSNDKLTSIVDDQQKKSSQGQSFADLYYYEPQNAERYESYQKKNPNLGIDEVVWQVNASLDEEFYMDFTEYEDNEDLNDYLIIVNKYHKLPDTFIPEERVDVGSGISMIKEAAKAFSEMTVAAKEENIHFMPQSGYRSYDYQSSLYENYKASDPDGADTYSARPGFSEHQTGLALDINIPSGGSLRNFIDTEQAKWVAENAHIYGFIVRYTEENKEITGYISEPWHIRYIGIQHAENMYNLRIPSYEEYKVKYIDHINPDKR